MRTARHRGPGAEPAKRRQAPGFTLLEMLLVLAILVAITAATIPVVARMYDTHRIQQAAMEVRAALSAARLRAVDGGEAVECRFEPQGRQLIILTRAQEGIRFGEAAERAAGVTQPAGKLLRVELPEPLYFWSAQETGERLSADDLRASGDDIAALANDTWSAPIVFAPDGTSRDTVFAIRDSQGRTVQLEVRGLTGAARSVTLEQGRVR